MDNILQMRIPSGRLAGRNLSSLTEDEIRFLAANKSKAGGQMAIAVGYARAQMGLAMMKEGSHLHYDLKDLAGSVGNGIGSASAHETFPAKGPRQPQTYALVGNEVNNHVQPGGFTDKEKKEMIETARAAGALVLRPRTRTRSPEPDRRPQPDDTPPTRFSKVLFQMRPWKAYVIVGFVLLALYFSPACAKVPARLVMRLFRSFIVRLLAAVKIFIEEVCSEFDYMLADAVSTAGSWIDPWSEAQFSAEEDTASFTDTITALFGEWEQDGNHTLVNTPSTRRQHRIQRAFALFSAGFAGALAYVFY
jgi:hypothetical protein